MVLTYTTVEAIALRLRGRLSVSASPGNFGPVQVDPQLIDQVGTQVESRINAQLSKVYRLPLRAAHPILASITEKGVLCELLAVHSVIPDQASGGVAASYRDLACRQFDAELQALLARSVELEGEIFATGTEIPAATYFTQATNRTSGKEIQF